METTIRQALLGTIGQPVSEDMLNVALIDADLDGEEEYDSSYRRQVDLAAIMVLLSIQNLKTIHEGTNIITINYDGVKAQLMYLARRAGRLDLIAELLTGQPKIRNATHKWGTG